MNEFKAAGGKIDETEKIRYLIKTLPASYSYIGDFIDVIPEKERTVDYVKSKIKENNLVKNNSDKKSNVNTFSTKTNEQCFTCGNIGHYQKDCWRNQQGGRGRGAQSSRGQLGNQRGYNRGRRRGRSSNQNKSTDEHPRRGQHKYAAQKQRK